MATKRTRPEGSTAQLKLDNETLRKLEQVAAARDCSVQEFLENYITQINQPTDPLLGLFRDDSALLDQVVEEAMVARANRPLRARLE